MKNVLSKKMVVQILMFCATEENLEEELSVNQYSIIVSI